MWSSYGQRDRRKQDESMSYTLQCSLGVWLDYVVQVKTTVAAQSLLKDSIIPLRNFKLLRWENVFSYHLGNELQFWNLHHLVTVFFVRYIQRRMFTDSCTFQSPRSSTLQTVYNIFLCFNWLGVQPMLPFAFKDTIRWADWLIVLLINHLQASLSASYLGTGMKTTQSL